MHKIFYLNAEINNITSFFIYFYFLRNICFMKDNLAEHRTREVSFVAKRTNLSANSMCYFFYFYLFIF